MANNGRRYERSAESKHGMPSGHPRAKKPRDDGIRLLEEASVRRNRVYILSVWLRSADNPRMRFNNIKLQKGSHP